MSCVWKHGNAKLSIVEDSGFPSAREIENGRLLKIAPQSGHALKLAFGVATMFIWFAYAFMRKKQENG